MKKARKKVTIKNTKGLHARAANAMVLLARNFDSEITVCSEGGVCASAKSTMDLLLLTASKGADIEVAAQGNDADMAVDAISDLVDNKFNEEE